MSTIADLWAVQVMDLTIEADRRRLNEIDGLLVETDELKAARQAVTECEATLERWIRRQRETEAQVRDLTQKISTAEKQLMSGRVRNPKELEGMQANVASLKRRQGDLEEEIILAMLEIDDSRARLSTVQKQLATVEGSWQAQQKELTAERSQLLAELQDLAGRFKGAWSHVSPADKELYRTLRSRKGGRALALMQRNTCQACGVGLPTSLAQQVRAGERIFCPTCGRLLHSRA